MIQDDNFGSRDSEPTVAFPRHLLKMEERRLKEFKMIRKVRADVKERICGAKIGFVQEVTALSDLKSGCPHDIFAEELSLKRGADIAGYVREGSGKIDKMSVSVKRQQGWDSRFLGQLSKNTEHGCSQEGLLITASFPNEDLNQDIWAIFDKHGRLVLMIKPRFVTILCYAILQIILYQNSLRNVLVSRVLKYTDQCNGYESFTTVKGDI